MVDGVEEAWTIGFVTDVILTRDPWMHRVDLARATGRAMALTADHDGVIVDDVVREWAGRHGQAYRLTLTGPAAAPGPPVRTARPSRSTRSSSAGSSPVVRRASGLLATQVPF